MVLGSMGRKAPRFTTAFPEKGILAGIDTGGIPSVVDDRTCFRQSLAALNNNSNISKSRSTLGFSAKRLGKKSRGTDIIFTKHNI